MERALYGPDGFYERGGAAGRRGDFLTSPEVGPLFAEVLLRAFDSACAPPYRVVEVGAGTGTLARHLLRLRPGLDLVLVERSAALRAHHAGLGVESRADLPAGPIHGIIFANELLDNIPFDLYERRPDGWVEVGVADGREALAPAGDPGYDVPVGGRVPVQRRASAFVTDALARIRSGRLVVIDYADTTPSLGRRPWTEWVRTYRSHQRGGHPLDRPGTQDVTVEVAVDQLDPPPTSDSSQAEFLRRHGLDDLVAEARSVWEARAAIGDLEALKARSRVSEAAALTDPAGLGSFRVLEWTVG
jgi:SAM-dependent MidA family methyltransferase